MANVLDILLHAAHGSILSIAHRGSSLRAPENTIAAFLMAIEEGADGVELDVWLTSDGEVVVIHDETLDRTTNGSGLVGKTSLEEIRRLDAGSWKGAEFANERVPTLEEVIRALPPTTVLCVEIKIVRHKYELVEKTLQILREYGVEKRTLILSFDLLILKRVQKIAPEFVTALIHYNINFVGPILSTLVKFTGRHQIDIQECRRINSTEIAKARRSGKFIIAGSTNSAEYMLQVLNLGVAGIMTEDPKLLADVLSQKDTP